ncbi:MAG TPA: TRAP transporter small permease [Clostridia bacterium]|nr:TRAP transporter small permease [Clostridia bacterium]
MRYFKVCLDGLEKICTFGAVLTFAVMIIMGAMQVLCRYVAFGNYLYFTEEVARYMFIWGVFLASPVCLRRQSHAAIELIVNWMPEKARRIALIAAALCCIVFFLIVLVKGGELVGATWKQASPAMEIPMGSVYLAIPVGSFIMLLYSVEQLIREINPKLAGSKAQGEVTEC